MKKLLLISLCLTIALAGCSEKFPFEVPRVDTGREITLEFNVSRSGAEITKTNLSVSGSGIIVNWSEGDKLYVLTEDYHYLGYATLTSGAGSADGIFKGTVVAPSTAQVLHLYYFGRNVTPDLSVSPYTFNIAAQDGTLEGIENNLHLMHGSTASAIPPDQVAPISVTMTSLISIGYFDFTSKSLLSAGTIITMTNAFSSAKLDLATGTFTSTSIGTVSLSNTASTANSYFVAFIPGTTEVCFNQRVGYADLSIPFPPSTEIAPSVFMSDSGSPIPVIDRGFSVHDSVKVFFSPGNLQYQASTGTWRFAEHQYDHIGSANSNISSSYSGWIDLFGWGTSGYNDMYPYMTSTSYSDYPTPNICFTNYDWGEYNPISNGGNVAGRWFTLQTYEWNYLMGTHEGATSGYCRDSFVETRFVKAIVNSVHGLIIFPDYYVHPSDVAALQNVNVRTAGYSSNNINLESWAKMEEMGAVFLPVTGIRYGTDVSESDVGYYWSSTSTYTDFNADGIRFWSSGFVAWNNNYSSNRNYGQAVRLVRYAPN